ncbi:MAG: hypothetical protein V1860_03675, partial [bacterium]
DIILKIGLLGMAAYLWLIWKIFKEGLDIILSKDHSPSFEEGERGRFSMAGTGDLNSVLTKEECERKGVINYKNCATENPTPTLPSKGRETLIAGCFLGLIIILATSIFSPYMNHPLGIGYIMLCSVALPIFGKAENLS